MSHLGALAIFVDVEAIFRCIAFRRRPTGCDQVTSTVRR